MKWLKKSVWLPMSRTRNAIRVPPMAMMKKPFCQRKVAFEPRIRTTVWSRTIDRDATRIHRLFDSNAVPQSVNIELLDRMPSEANTGPRARTEKNLAKNAAPARPPKIMATFEIRPSGGLRIRLTQT